MTDYDDFRTPTTMQDVLARWLVAEGLAEEHAGYGHATGEQVAERLLAAFDVRFKEPAHSGSSET